MIVHIPALEELPGFIEIKNFTTAENRVIAFQLIGASASFADAATEILHSKITPIQINGNNNHLFTTHITRHTGSRILEINGKLKQP